MSPFSTFGGASYKLLSKSGSRLTIRSPASEFASNQHGVNILLVRLEDLAQFDALDTVTLDRLESNLNEVIRLVREALPRMGVPLIFVLCPPSEARREFAHEMALRIETMLEGTPGILYLSHEEIQQLYPVAEPSSAEGERLGHIPYTELYFCALGTALVRLMHGLYSPPFKVIALDCDNTLWKGICGEDGPRGVTLDPARHTLQEFMKEQHDSGMLLGMASKNNEPDVLEIFATHPEMPLQLRHFVAWRLNWDAKSSNLRALSSELSLSLDSFILVDDNPKECAEVAESIPEVLAVALPAEADEIPHFLEHIWAFDHVLVTEEDRNRSAHYKTSLEFGRELKQASNLESFMNALDLQVRIQPCTPSQLGRVAQLTERTNQFNFTTIRRTEAEIAALLADGRLESLTMDVSDRFGDYGLTGVALFRTVEDALVIDTLLLSCRVLGRGVEHRVLAHLAREALRRGLETVIATFESTAKNEPARRFLHEIGARFEQPTESGFSYSLPAAELRALYPLAARAAEAEVRGRIVFLEQSANRRLARDCERMESYYGGLLAQLEKRAARRGAEPQAAEKERGRIEATRLDRAAKLQDLVRKYSLRVQLELTDVLVVSLPVRTMAVRLIRKKEERQVTLAWNAILRALDTPLCEACSGRARPIYLCDAKVHVLCGACLSPCAACGRTFCRACQAKCKCGAAGNPAHHH